MSKDLKKKFSIWNLVSEKNIEFKILNIIFKHNLFIKDKQNNKIEKEFLLTNSYIIYISDYKYKKFIDLKMVKVNFNINELYISFYQNKIYFNLYFKNILIYFNWKKKLEELCFKKDFIKKFIILNAIGEGGTSTVFKAKKISNKKIYAIKYLKKNNKTINKILNEINIMRKLRNHPNIVNLYEVYENDNSFFLVLDYAHHNNLRKFLKGKYKFKINKKEIIKSILNGIDYIHINGYVHRDIKPENIFIYEENGNIIPKIGDFGLTISYKQICYSLVGTYGYIDPNLFNPYNFNYNKVIFESDIYSLGVLFYYIFIKKSIFNFNDKNDLIYKNKNNIINFDNKFYKLDISLQKIIKECLNTQFYERISLENLILYFN